MSAAGGADDPPNCKISIYADDHLPPHFHVESRGFCAAVAIETMTVRAGDRRRAADAIEWAERNIELLQAEWLRLNNRR